VEVEKEEEKKIVNYYQIPIDVGEDSEDELDKIKKNQKIKHI